MLAHLNKILESYPSVLPSVQLCNVSLFFVPYRVLICQLGDVEDVVAQHRQRNRAPSLPSNSQLLSVRKRQNSQSSRRSQTAGSKNSRQGSVLDGLDPSDFEAPVSTQLQPPTVQPSVSKVHVCPPSDSRLQSAVPGPGILPDNADPSQLQSYPPAVRDIIERAKQFSHCDVASINSFPMRPDFNSKAIEYINKAIAERRGRSLPIPDGNYYRRL